MNKIKRVWDWVCHLIDELSTYKVDGQIRGKMFLYHSGSIVNVQVAYNRNHLEKQHHSITTNTTNSNFAQPSVQENQDSQNQMMKQAN